MSNKLDAGEVLRRASLWAQARAHDLPDTRSWDVKSVEHSNELLGFFQWFERVLEEDSKRGLAIARAILAADRGEKGDVGSRILDLFDSDSEADRDQACDLLLAAESSELWKTVMDGATTALATSKDTGYTKRGLHGREPAVDEVLAGAVGKDATTVVLAHRTLRDSSQLRKALFHIPDFDYGAITSIAIAARHHDSLEMLSRLVNLEELVLDLRRDPLTGAKAWTDAVPARISLRGLDALPKLTKLTLILEHETSPTLCNACGESDWGMAFDDENLEQSVACNRCSVVHGSMRVEVARANWWDLVKVLGYPWRCRPNLRAAHSPHWQFAEGGWRFADDWTKHLGRIEQLRVFRPSLPPGESSLRRVHYLCGQGPQSHESPKRYAAPPSAYAHDPEPGLPDVFPYALTEHMPSLKSLELRAPVSYAALGRPPALDKLTVRSTDAAYTLPPVDDEAGPRTRITARELILVAE